MSIKSSKTSRGVVVVNIPPPRWESFKKDNDSKDKIPTLENTSYNNVYIYNFYTSDERNRYNGFGQGSKSPNPTFDFSKLSNSRNIAGGSLDSDGFYKMASNKVPSYIKLSWDAPEGYENLRVANSRTLREFKELVGLSRHSPEGPRIAIDPMKQPTNYSSFEQQQNDYVRITNEYLDMFSGVNSDGSIVNDWFAEEVDSSGFSDRQNFLWDRVVEGDKSYKNFRNFGTKNNWSEVELKIPSLSEKEIYFSNSPEVESASVVNVSDSSLLENLDFPNSDAIPEDITVVQNSEYSWRTKILSHGFSGRILGTQERIRNSSYWNEFMNKLNIKKASGDIEQTIGQQPGPLESTLIRSSAYKTRTINAGQGGGLSDFQIVGFVIEKEQVVEPGELDEPGVPISEKFPLIFVPCRDRNVPSTYLDAAVNYDKEYKYTIRAIYYFTIVVPLGDGNRSQERSYFVNSTYSNVLKIETRESKSPSFPRDLGAFYEYYKTGLTLNWAFPVDQQRDTTYFAIFRRKSIYEPFKMLQVYDFNYSISDPTQSRDEIKFLLEYGDYHEPQPDPDVPATPVPNNFDLVKRLKHGDSNTSYTDFEFKPNTDYIYTVCSIDAHGQISNYSSQLKVNLDSRTHKLSIRQVSPPGAPLVFPNWFIKTKAFVDVARTARYRRAILKFRPDYKKVRIGPGKGEIRDIVKTTDKAQGGNSKNCYYLQILNPDRKEDVVLKYHINDSSDFDISLYEEREEVAGLVGLPAGSIGRSKE